ncbi:MAG: ornithine carbamoyltransferase [Dermatophilus congolensis]|nr:ornithine carbamoyltransferase [Dermatophilus congolensis]
MPFNLRSRSFVKEIDFTPVEWRHLIRLAAELKRAKYAGTETPRLRGKNLALIFEKTSTRTRAAFEVAAHDQGATTTYLDSNGSQIGHKESIKDTARVLGRFYDGIQYRGKRQTDVEILAEHAGVPVWNGLTDEWHPTQMLADHLTLTEHVHKPFGDITYAYVGDARNNVGNSFLITGAMMGMDVRMVAPEPLLNAPEVVTQAREITESTGARITLTSDAAEGVRGADVLYTDVWVSMGEPEESWEPRVEQLRPYQVNAALMEATGNPDTKFMHCLPAYHDRNTSIGEKIYQRMGMDGIEVTEEVFESTASIVFDQSENRMHTIKAIMVATLGW